MNFNSTHVFIAFSEETEGAKIRMGKQKYNLPFWLISLTSWPDDDLALYEFLKGCRLAHCIVCLLRQQSMQLSKLIYRRVRVMACIVIWSCRLMVQMLLTHFDHDDIFSWNSQGTPGGGADKTKWRRYLYWQPISWGWFDKHFCWAKCCTNWSTSGTGRSADFCYWFL